MYAVHNETDGRLNQNSSLLRRHSSLLHCSCSEIPVLIYLMFVLGSDRHVRTDHGALCYQSTDCLIDAFIFTDGDSRQNRSTKADGFLSAHDVQTTPG